MNRIDFTLHQEIISSSKKPEEKFQDIVDAAKSAKKQEMTRRETADLFGNLWNIDTAHLRELDGYISAVLDMICGYCVERCRIWPGVWGSEKD